MVNNVNTNAATRFLTLDKQFESKTQNKINNVTTNDSDKIELSAEAKAGRNENLRDVRAIKIPEPHRSTLENVFRLIREGKALPKADFDLSWDTVRASVTIEGNEENVSDEQVEDKFAEHGNSGAAEHSFDITVDDEEV